MAFLHIHLHGLLNIFESADMLLFGFLISAITHQISKEVVPGYDADKKKEGVYLEEESPRDPDFVL